MAAIGRKMPSPGDFAAAPLRAPRSGRGAGTRFLDRLGDLTASEAAPSPGTAQRFRSRKIRFATHDLRIAAISVAHRVKLISRNRRDFDRVPGLDVEYWT